MGSDALRLSETVIEGGYCIGCGICAAVQSSPFAIEVDSAGRFQARLVGDPAMSDAPFLTVCPFADAGPHEDQVGRAQFGDLAGAQKDPYLGYLLGAYVGYVAEPRYRAAGGSGGLGTWILSELLRRDLVDFVLHVKPSAGESDDSGLLFRYDVSETVDEVFHGAKSRYYPVEMSSVVAAMRSRPGRYAVVGVPCFIKGLRRLAVEDPVINERLSFTVGLFCGHLKSANFAAEIGWEHGILPDRLSGIDFRVKLPGRPANRYGVQVTATDGTTAVGSMSDVFGFRWSYGFFKYRACDYCDDVVAETADVSIGDAWLPGYANDSDGTNVVIVRNPVVLGILREANSDGRLMLEDLDAESAYRSQESGFRHRRDGLAYRLHSADAASRWRPHKRVVASRKHLRRAERDVFDLRVQLAERSHEAFMQAVQAGSFAVFRDAMTPLMERHDAAAARRYPRWRRLLGQMRRKLGSVVRRARLAARAR